MCVNNVCSLVLVRAIYIYKFNIYLFMTNMIIKSHDDDHLKICTNYVIYNNY